RLRRPRGARATLRSRRAPGHPGGVLLRARAERGLRDEAPEPLARRPRRVGRDAPSGTGDELVQPALPAPRAAPAAAPGVGAGPDRRREGGRAFARLPVWQRLPPRRTTERAACSVRPVPHGVTIGSRPQLKPASDVGPRRMAPAQARTRSTAKVGSNSNHRAAKFSPPGAR